MAIQRLYQDKQRTWQFSPKQLALMLWWQNPKFSNIEGVIAYGSVRSGKTVGMSNGFVLWAMTRFNGQNFAICGKTIGSTNRNVIMPLKNTLPDFGFRIEEKKSEHCLRVFASDGTVNTFYLFGGKDEGSQDLIQGITLAGIYFDEVTLQPESFVQQGMSRCSVTGSKLWFNCNPEAPRHWFKTNIVDQYQRLHFLVMHFSMQDNYSLDPKIVERYMRTFVGVFYKRYILGEWAVSEGIIYPQFSEDTNSTPLNCSDLFIKDAIGNRKFNSARFAFPTVSMDYGNTNATVMLLWVWDKEDRTFLCVQEGYYDGHGTQDNKMDDLQRYKALEELVGDVPLHDVVIDPSAESMINMIRNRHRFNPIPARNEVVPGIALTQVCLSLGKIRFNLQTCPSTVGEFGLYTWDAKEAERGNDAPVKVNDHGMDAVRYLVQTVIRRRASYFGLATVGSVDKAKVRESRA